MCPKVHPPCTPSPACMPLRCHPTPPPCRHPEKCLERTTKRHRPPCQSALSVLAERGSRCGKCRPRASRKRKYLKRYLRHKNREIRIKYKDKINGTNKYAKYKRRTSQRGYARTHCCAGQGHRGPQRRRCCPCCLCCTLL